MPLRGKYHALIDDNAANPAGALVAIAHLVHEQALDPVPLEGLGIGLTDHEARWSESCELCGTIWIGTKAGEVLCIHLCDDPPRVWKLTLERGVRTLLHLHGPNAFGPDKTLLVGTDDGYLRRIHEIDGKPVESNASLHVDSWWGDGASGDTVNLDATASSPHVVRATESVARSTKDRYANGITAMARLRGHERGASPILIATRRGAIYLLDAAPGATAEPARLRLRLLHIMSGWVQWILELPDRAHITCISRGGELIQISTTDPERGITLETLPLLPTAAVPFHEGFLLGTTEGLLYWSEQDRRHRVVALPVTRSPVLCLDRMTLPEKDHRGATDEREYVILGLDNGRLRGIPSDTLRDLAEGRPAASTVRGGATDLGSSVLAVEALKPTRKAMSRRYLLAALRDHSLRLFHVDRFENTEAMIEQQWAALAREAGAPTDRETAEALLASATTPADRNAIRYFLLQIIHRRIDVYDTGTRAWLVGQIPTFLRQASPALLRLVAIDLGKLVGNDVDALLATSLALLEALPRRYADWRRVAEQHLKVLNDASRALPREDGARLMAWTRFALKYVILGHTFSERKFALKTLIRTNYRSHKYLDALIFQALLHQRRHDLEWSADVEGDIQRLHATRSLVIAATLTGTFCFFSASGQRLRVLSGGVESSSASLGVDGGHLLASTIVESGSVTHLIVSWSSPFELRSREPSLCVFAITHVVERGASPGSGREYVSIQRSAVRPDPAAHGRPPVTVHSLCVVPFAGDLLLAGLDDAAYHFGFIKRSGDTWSLLLLNRGGAAGASQGEPSALASGKVPSRAIAASCLDDNGILYLAAIGSERGDVSFVWFDIAHKVSRTETVSLRYPINAIELSNRGGDSKSTANTRDCYVGTASGETFAGSVLITSGGVQPIWRETSDSAVIAVGLWRTPLYEDAEGKRQVLVTATEQGRICFHETRQASSDAPQISELNNFSFRGLRLDQITLPSALTSFTVVEGTTDFVAAGPDGRLFKGSFCFLRESRDRVTRVARDGFPENLWEAFEQIHRKMIKYDHLFFSGGDGADSDLHELDILGLVHLQHGALRCYLLRRQLSGDELGGPEEDHARFAQRTWGADSESIEASVRARLHDLRPERREDRERIKIVLKALGTAFLDRPLGRTLDEVERAESAEALTAALAPEHEAVCAVVEIIKRQILEAARNPTSLAGKVRNTAVKQVFRVHVFRHLALESGDARPIRDALLATITSCLGDDDRLVRVEALRSVGIMLRNFGVLRKRLSPAAADRFMAHVFPNGVSDLFWLVSALTENLKRYTDFSVGTTHATTWYYLSAIVAIFLLFPESTLRLCDSITRAGVSRAALVVVAGRLPGKVGKHVQSLIAKFYLVPCLAEDQGRKRFLNDYKKSTVDVWLRLEKRNLSARDDAPSSRDTTSEARISDRWIVVYDMLARFWEIEHAGRFTGFPSSVEFEASVSPDFAPAPEIPGDPGHRSPLGLAETVCEGLSDLARNLKPPCRAEMADDNAKSDAISALRTQIDSDAYEGLLQPVRAIACKILDHWQSFYEGQVPGEGSAIKGHVLGRCLGEGGYGRVYVADPEIGSRQPVAAKIFRHIYDPEGKKREQFLLSAKLNKHLSDGTETRGLVRVHKVIEKPHPLFIMQLCDHDLEHWGARYPDLSLTQRYRHAVSAAAQLGAGLAAAHAQGITHGDVKASNILVRGPGRELHFELADFGMAHEESGMLPPSTCPPPTWTARAFGGQRAIPLDWLDAYALARVLYQVFLRPPLPPLSQGAGEDELTAACKHLATIPCDDVPELKGLITPLLKVLDGTCLEAHEFLDAICRNTLRAFPDPPPSSRRQHGHFTQDELFAFCTTVIEAHLTRDSLLNSIPAAITAGLPDNLPPREQLLTDLNRLNTWPSSAAQHPIKTWLKNAFFHTDSALFTKALKRLPR